MLGFYKGLEAPESARRFAWVTTDTFGEGGQGMQQYYLASHFDKIFMQPSGMIGLLGIHLPTFFYKKLLAKVGIEPEFFKFFEYKNAPNAFTEDHFTEAHRHQTQSLADSLFHQIVSTIARERGMSQDAVRNCIDSAPLLASEGLKVCNISRVQYSSCTFV
jgi:protease-4